MPIRNRVAIPLLLLMALTGCTSSAIRDLQFIVAGSEAVVAALGATGAIPAPVAASVNLYMGQVSEFVTFATTELASSDSTAVKASRIAAEAVSVSKPDLPPGTPTLIATSIQAVAVALATFLNHIQSVSAALEPLPTEGPSAPGANAFAAASGYHVNLKISKADQKKLDALHARALALKKRFPKK